MTNRSAVEALLTRVVVMGGAAFGITDDDLPPSVRAMLPLAAAIVLGVMYLSEHATRQNTAVVSVEAARVAGETAQAARMAPPAPAVPGLSGDVLAAAMAGVGAALERSRAGVVAAAGPRHGQRDDTAVLPRIPADDYPTAAMPAVPSVPSPLIGA